MQVRSEPTLKTRGEGPVLRWSEQSYCRAPKLHTGSGYSPGCSVLEPGPRSAGKAEGGPSPWVTACTREDDSGSHSVWAQFQPPQPCGAWANSTLYSVTLSNKQIFPNRRSQFHVPVMVLKGQVQSLIKPAKNLKWNPESCSIMASSSISLFG